MGVFFMTTASFQPGTTAPPWKILVVDDEEDIHAVTRLALKKYQFKGRQLKLLHASTIPEAQELLLQHPEIAIVILDVVMETPHAGLDFIAYLRHELHNSLTRIILRTGQPDEAPEMEVIENFEIDDYRLKTELTQEKLKALITTTLRAYNAILEVEMYRQDLEKKVAQRTAKIQSQKQELEQVNALKSKILTVVAQDLRKPLATLRSAIGLTEKQSLTPESLSRLMGSIKSNLNQSSFMMEQLLLWARAQLDGFTLTPVPVQARTWLESMLGLYTERAQEKGVVLRILECPENLELEIDVHLMTIVLRNLLNNGIKFTPASGQVSLSLRQESSLVIEVQDTGVGMSNEQLLKIQAREIISDSGTQGEKGSGLGLMLSQDLVQLHRGFISMSSQPQVGTTAQILLPSEYALSS